MDSEFSLGYEFRQLISTVSDKKDTESVRKEIFNIFKKYIKDNFHFHVELTTVRRRRGAKKKYLRCVYSEPKELAKYFEKPEDSKRFKFNVSAYSDKIQPLVEFDYKEKSVKLFFEEFKLQKCKSSKKSKFEYRIPDALSEMAKQGYIDQEILSELMCRGSALVFGLVKETNGEEKGDIADIEELVALYGIGGKELQATGAFNLELLGQSILTFQLAFSDLDRLDHEIFRRESHRLISKYTKDFADHSLAPGICVGKFLDELKSVCNDHPSMGSTLDKGDIWPRYINLRFVTEEQTDTIIPKMEIYPLPSSKEMQIDAIYFAHPLSKSITKLAVEIWIHKNSKEFKKNGVSYFKPKSEHLKGQINPELLITNAKRRKFPISVEVLHFEESDFHGVYATDHGRKFWSEYNIAAHEDASENHTTLVFLIYSNVAKSSKIPIGALVFESRQLDAFSDKDIDVLKELSDAVSILINLKGLGQTQINYEEKIKNSIFQDILTPTFTNNPSFAKLAYEIIRMEYETLLNLISDQGKVKWIKVFKSTMPCDIEKISDFSKEFFKYNFPSDREKYLKREEWLVQNYTTLKEVWEKYKNHRTELLNFFEMLPSNQKWKARLFSVPRALKNRVLSNPTLKRFPVGFSSDSIFLLDQADEIRQVLKFSSEEKIEIENDAYQQFVRYKIPLAARISHNGFAIEKTEDKKHAGHGVIVSDLVAGSRRINAEIESLFDKCHMVLRDFYKATETETNDEIDLAKKTKDAIISAIGHHFNNNVQMWKNLSESDRGKILIADALNGKQPNKQLLPISLQDRISYSARIWSADVNFNITSDLFSLNIQHKLEKTGVDAAITCKMLNFAEDCFFTWMEFYKIDANRILDSGLKTYAFGGKYKNKICDFVVEENLEKQNSGNLLENEIQSMISAASVPVPDNAVNSNKYLDIIHGDLNPQNLTWADTYQKFLLIDFEHCRVGYKNSDQLKLMFSLVQKFYSGFLGLQEAVAGNDATIFADNLETTLYLLSTISWLLSKGDINEVSVDSILEFLQTHAFRRLFRIKRDENQIITERQGGVETKIKSDESMFLAKLIKTIFLTMVENCDSSGKSYLNINTTKFHKSLIETKLDISSLQRAIRVFAAKELEYALGALEVQDQKAMKKILKIDKEKVDCLHKLIHPLRDERNRESAKRVSTVISAFLAFRSVCCDDQ